ncbi:MAG: transketolase [Bacilli bacterium]
MNNRIDDLAINSLRVLSVEAIAKANSGHPGIALGAAPMLHTLFSRFMKYTPNHPDWINRDRFVLSAGHGSSLLYSMLYLNHYIGVEDLKSFRQLNSITPGHPEVHLTKGVDLSTGPLGQGISMAVGMAMAEAHLNAKFNKLVDHYTYVICGDGDLQEGVTQEAISFAGTLQLSKLIVLYDSNDIQLDGPTIDSFTENTKMKFESLNWDYQLVEDGTSVSDIEKAILKAQKTNKPSLIEIKTIIGLGASNQGTSSVHGSPLKKDEVLEMRSSLGGDAFSVPKEVFEYYNDVIKNNDEVYDEWIKTKEECNDEIFNNLMLGNINIDFDKMLTNFDKDYNAATRVSGGIIIKELANLNPMLIGGSADLSSSTKVAGVDGIFSFKNRIGRHIKFGVREHAMAAISNGLSLHGGLRPYCSGFFVFSDYMKPAIRLSALMEQPVIYIFTHDSIAVGEDGPTHQPIEQLTMLRSIPNLNVIRPADANETKAAFKIALESKKTPTVIVLTRQDVPTITDNPPVNKGAYIYSDYDDLDGIILASGSEVSVCKEAVHILKTKYINVRLVSIPSTNLFDQQSKEYINEILPKNITKRLAVEMSEASHLYKYVGLDGDVYAINTFGKSAKGNEVVEDYGYTAVKIAEAFLKL